jgi:hypothetical protein
MDKSITIESLKKKLNEQPCVSNYTCDELKKTLTEQTFKRIASSRESILSFYRKAGIYDEKGKLTSKYKR